MSDLPCTTEPLDQTVQRWARKLRASSGWTVETILATAENLLAALQELEPHGPKARDMLAAEARLSRPTMSRLETIGRHAGMLRLRAANLPPYVSSLYVLTRKPFAQFKKAIETDLRGLSRSEIAALFSPAQVSAPRRRLITIAAPADIADETRRAVMADIHAALARIGEAHGIGLALSPRSRRRRPGNAVRRAPTPTLKPRRVGAPRPAKRVSAKQEAG
jgi:hypothetical protein